MTVTPCLLLPRRTLDEARAERQRAKFERAAARVAGGEMPRCKWAAGGHRYDLLKVDAGRRIEVCMDCGGGARIYPANLSSKHSKPYDLATGKTGEWARLGDAKVIDFPSPASEFEAAVGPKGFLL